MAQKITPNLWFDGNAQEVVDFYLTVFSDGKIISTESKPLGIFDWRPGSFTYPVIPCRFWMTEVRPKKIFPALLFEVN